MADSLYLSIWFPTFREGEMMPRTVGVLRQFPFSTLREGITYLSVHPVAWTEPTVLERRFDPGISPEEAVEIASEFAHDDFAFVFEAFWDIWVPNDDEHGDSWVQRPVAVRFLVHGLQFDEGIYTDDGHIEVDFGLDSSFVFEGRTSRPPSRNICALTSPSWLPSPPRSRRTVRSADACCGRNRKKTWRRS